MKPREPKSTPALKRSAHEKNTIPDAVVDFVDPVCAGLSVTYLYLIVDILLDRDCMQRCRITLSRLFSSIKSANPQAIIIPCETELERFNNKK